MVKIVKANPLFMTEVNMPIVELNIDDYKSRLKMLVERMKKYNLTHVIIYGDREHFANVEYFAKYDCRFEETLFIVDATGTPSIIVGNEGWGYSQIIPYEISRYLYQNFSLQGQPRDKLIALDKILNQIGIHQDSKIGVVGFKYFNQSDVETDVEQTYDLPKYMVDAIKKSCPNICNFTKEITGLPDGIRMRLYTAKEIAWAESAGNRSASVVQRMLKGIKPGIREYELSMVSGTGFDPHNCHPLTSFGAENVGLGMRSPTDRALEIGEVCGLCYGIRGNLTSKVSIAAYDIDTCKEELKPYIESFYMKQFEAMVNWYEAINIGATGGEIYNAVMSVIGDKKYGVTLNPGHNTGTDEWTNSPCFSGSELLIMDGMFMQADIIASGKTPVRTAICEDAIVVAGEKLQGELRSQYPEVYKRIQERRQIIKDVLKIKLSEDVLPMSNLNAVNFPFLLNTDLVFAI
ncbi:MAG: hypothetical protein ACYDG2_14430 [Ruminiclostridium sp.]